MRIIAGDLGGRVIASPSEKTTRPTTDRVRESMFSSLFSRLGTFEGVSVFDAFSGSGALGIEALSRGAARCLFFERDADARAVLAENLASLQLRAPRAELRGDDVLVACQQGALSRGCPFELVLLDPPYALPAAHVLELLDARMVISAANQAGLPFRLFAISALGAEPDAQSVGSGGIIPFRVLDVLQAALAKKRRDLHGIR